MWVGGRAGVARETNKKARKINLFEMAPRTPGACTQGFPSKDGGEGEGEGGEKHPKRTVSVSV